MTEEPPACGGAVLAGGRSSRMGRDKATLVWRGEPLALRTARTLARAGCHPVIQVGGSTSTGVEHVADHFPGQGPLGGVLTALDSLPGPLVAVVACDLPLLKASTIGQLIGAMCTNERADVALASSGRSEPLCGVWRTENVRDRLLEWWQAGERSLRGVLTGLHVDYVAVDPGEFLNANTPDDLVRADNVGAMIEEITVQQLSDLMAAPLTLIDVREPDEYAGGHAPGAVLVPLGSLLAGEVSIQGAGPVYMICRSGARSMRACQWLEQQGLTAVNVAGGTLAWVSSGFDTVEGMDPT